MSNRFIGSNQQNNTFTLGSDVYTIVNGGANTQDRIFVTSRQVADVDANIDATQTIILDPGTTINSFQADFFGARMVVNGTSTIQMNAASKIQFGEQVFANPSEFLVWWDSENRENGYEVTGDEIDTGPVDTVNETATYEFNVVQNGFGAMVNTLGTGQKVVGTAEENTLKAELVNNVNFNGDTLAVRPVTENIQNVHLDARAVNSEDSVLLDADKMVGVKEWWSNNSDTTLIVENVTTTGNTEDVAIGMRSTGNAGRNGDRTESNYEVYFKEDHLVSGQAAGFDRLGFRMMDQDAVDAGQAELSGYALNSLSFQLDGTIHTLTFDEPNADDKPNTWAEMIAHLNAALRDQKPELVADNDIQFVQGGTFRDPNGRVGTEIELRVDNAGDETRLTSPEGLVRPHLAINFSDSTSENIFRFVGEIDGRGVTDLPITSTIILDDVGRGSDGGYLKVGSMSEGSQGSTGVEVFDVTVQRDSSLSYMVSTNDALRVVNVSNADGFSGDLTLGNTRTGDSNGGYGLQDIEVFNASGMRGDVELTALVSNLANHTYTLGAGNDTLNIDVSEQSSAYAQFGLVVDATAGGNNTINVDLVSTGNSNVADNWYANQSALNNITINAGSGNDVIWTQGAGDARISAGRGDDVVYTDNTGEKAVWTLNATNALNDLIGIGDAAVNNPAILDKLVIRVTYNDQAGGAAAADAETLGFEATVNLANHLNSNGRADINAAVKAAIESDHVLNALLSVKIGPNNSIIIESKVDGAMHQNAVQIDAGFLTQNGSVNYTAPTAGNLDDYFSASDISAMQDALKATSSADPATIATVVTQLGAAQNAVGTNYNDTLNQQQAGADSTAGSSNIITFTGGHDVVVLGTGTGADVINIGAGVTNTDKLTLVNFDFAEDRVNFSSLLNTQVFTASVTAGSMATAGVTAGGNVNSVNLVNGFAPTANQPQWDSLSNTQVLEALRGTAGAEIEGLTNATAGGLIAAANTAFATPAAAGTVPRTDTIEHLLLLQNPANDGEYKVFRVELTWDGANDTAVYSRATELLTMDFGREVTDVNNPLLTGGATPTNDLSATEYDLEDGLVINTPNEHVQVNVPFGVQADNVGVAINALSVEFNFGTNQTVTLSQGSSIVTGGNLTVSGGTLDARQAQVDGVAGIILNSGLVVSAAQASAFADANIAVTSTSGTSSRLSIETDSGERVALNVPKQGEGELKVTPQLVELVQAVASIPAARDAIAEIATNPAKASTALRKVEGIDAAKINSSLEGVQLSAVFDDDGNYDASGLKGTKATIDLSEQTLEGDYTLTLAEINDAGNKGDLEGARKSDFTVKLPALEEITGELKIVNMTISNDGKEDFFNDVIDFGATTKAELLAAIASITVKAGASHTGIKDNQEKTTNYTTLEITLDGTGTIVLENVINSAEDPSGEQLPAFTWADLQGGHSVTNGEDTIEISDAQGVITGTGEGSFIAGLVTVLAGSGTFVFADEPA